MGGGHRGNARSQGNLSDDWRSAPEGREALRHAASRSRRNVRRAVRGQQRHSANRFRSRSGQEDQADAQLSDEHRPKLRRGVARCGFAATDGETRGLYSGKLEKRGRRDHLRLGIGRRREKEVSTRLEVAKAVHSHHSSTKVGLSRSKAGSSKRKEPELAPSAESGFFTCSLTDCAC